MKKILLSLLFLGITVSFAAKPKHSYVKITTTKGNCTIMLYNQTPKHRNNFLKLVKEGFYNGTLFHRVIENFMIQGGDPNSKTAAPGQLLGDGGLEYTIDAEFRDSLFHKKGVLAATTDNNLAKASSSCQFYIVQGNLFTDEQLDYLETNRLQGRKIPVWQREIYKTIGGVPHLDKNYTVFGEIVSGLALVDSIAAVKTDQNSRPVEDIKMDISILKTSEVRKIEKELMLKQ